MPTDASQPLISDIDQLIEQNPLLDEFEVLAVDICGHFFGKRYPISKLKSFAREGLAFPASMFVLSTIGDVLPEITYGQDDGDPDAHFELVPGSLCLAKWGNKPRAQVLATTTSTDAPAFFEPRHVLKNVLQAYQKNNWRPMVAFELEFYLFHAERDQNNMIQTVRNPKTGRKDTATVLSASRIADFEEVIEVLSLLCNRIHSRGVGSNF
ncbi:MAG: hypothetical protein AAF353_20830 [Pseudomonadota bacterium]